MITRRSDDDAAVILNRDSHAGTTHLTELADYIYLNFGIFGVSFLHSPEKIRVETERRLRFVKFASEITASLWLRATSLFSRSLFFSSSYRKVDRYVSGSTNWS